MFSIKIILQNQLFPPDIRQICPVFPSIFKIFPVVAADWKPSANKTGFDRKVMQTMSREVGNYRPALFVKKSTDS
jgi:hypothetical protein